MATIQISLLTFMTHPYVQPLENNSCFLITKAIFETQNNLKCYNHLNKIMKSAGEVSTIINIFKYPGLSLNKHIDIALSLKQFSYTCF